MRPFCSPAGLALRALGLWVFFAVVHGTGGRVYMTLLSGTWPAESHSQLGAGLRFGLYAVAYFGAVAVAPILLIAAGLLAVAPSGGTAEAQRTQSVRSELETG